ncbi:MAG: hypothetical protein ABI400_10830 [Lacisediminihabitans sp.]
MLVFGAIQAGANIPILHWLGWFGHTLLFTIVGSVLLVAALRLMRTKEFVKERRHKAPADPDALHKRP